MQSIESAEAHSPGKAAEDGMVRMYLNIGKNHGASAGNILAAITSESGISGDVVGVIDMYDKFTFVELPQKYEEKVLKSMSKNRIKGRKINIERATTKKQ
jgi:ATP-dependent RNA helicase DeaD